MFQANGLRLGKDLWHYRRRAEPSFVAVEQATKNRPIAERRTDGAGLTPALRNVNLRNNPPK